MYTVNAKISFLPTPPRFPPQNIMSCCWVQAQHKGRAPGDCCIVTGFPDGTIGVWHPTYPTEAGKGYRLAEVMRAHEAGKPLLINQASFGGSLCVVIHWCVSVFEGSLRVGSYDQCGGFLSTHRNLPRSWTLNNWSLYIVLQDGLAVTAGCSALRLRLDPEAEVGAHRRPRLEK